MDLAADCPQPSGVWKPVLAGSGKPALGVGPDTEDPSTPAVVRKPAMADAAFPEQGYTELEPGITVFGDVTRLDATGITVDADGEGLASAGALLWIRNAGHSQVRAELTVTGFGTGSDRGRASVSVLSRQWSAPHNRYIYKEVAYVPEALGGGLGITEAEPVAILGVWHLYVLLLRVIASGDGSAGTISLDLTYV